MCSRLFKSTKPFKSALFALLAVKLFAAAPDSAIDAIFAPLVPAHSPGAAVLVRQKGDTIFSRGYGVRDLRSLHKIDARTNFRLASVTKQFTAMAIMLLVRDGRLRYDQTLSEIFPGFPSYGKAITIRHLLTHTSGLADYEELMEAREKTSGAIWSATHQIHDEDVLTLLAQQNSGIFAPGTSWAYSNSGYVVLGLVVAKVAGEPYFEFLRRRIFLPLGMSKTIAYVNGQNTIRNRAYGHSKKGEQFEETDQSSTSATLGDGGIYSNLIDLARWDDALRNGILLKKTDMAPALDPVKLNDGTKPHWPAGNSGDNLAPGKPVSYGFGWFLDPLDNRTRIWHTGSTSGFRNVIERFPDEGLTILILCNRTDLNPAQLAEKIARLNPQ
jgi:CubicO group peptidase (beta-lactamase class C family)